MWTKQVMILQGKYCNAKQSIKEVITYFLSTQHSSAQLTNTLKLRSIYKHSKTYPMDIIIKFLFYKSKTWMSRPVDTPQSKITTITWFTINKQLNSYNNVLFLIFWVKKTVG